MKKDITDKEMMNTENTKAECPSCSEADGADMDHIPDCCRHRTKERSEKEYKALLNRLSRIEGQIRGIKKMLQNNVYCIDIINQTAAANSALNSFTKELLANHIRTCVTRDIKEGKEETVEELLATLQKLMK